MKVANPLAKKGEDIAAEYLQKHGFQIIQRNFHIKGGEIDVIAIDATEKEPVLAFIEVKTRTSNTFGTGFEAITPWKIRSITKTALFYKATQKNLPDAMRIDAISVLIIGKEITIELIKNIG